MCDSAITSDRSGSKNALRVPRIAFLGICERFEQLREGNSNVMKLGMLGLKTICLSHVFPLPASHLNLVFAVFQPITLPPITLRLRNSAEKEVLRIDLSLTRIDETAVEVESGDIAESVGAPGAQDTGSATGPSRAWGVFAVRVDASLAIVEPGTYELMLDSVDEDEVLGAIHFVHISPPPLSADRIAAIRSDPTAANAVRLSLDCKTCGDKLRVYAGLERLPVMEQEGFVWYTELPSDYTCRCGELAISLEIMRRDLHGVLGTAAASDGSLGVMPLYQLEQIRNACREYHYLLETAVSEETLQQFLESHPYFLHQFSSTRFFCKAPVLSECKTDFAIVNSQSELLLIEIEPATLRLMNADGGRSAKLTHAFDQVHSWLDIVEQHRLAVLRGIGIPFEDVARVRGVVIAGRNKGYNPRHLRRLKGIDHGQVTLLTHDDLLRSVVALARTIAR